MKTPATQNGVFQGTRFSPAAALFCDDFLCPVFLTRVEIFFDSVKVLENHVTSSSWWVLRSAKLKTRGPRYLLGTYSSGNVVPVIW